MKIARSDVVRILIAVSAEILYAVLFLVLYPSGGATAGALNAIPAITFGWLFGLRGSMLYALAALPINIILFSIFGSDLSALIPNIIGVSAFTLTSAGVGWVRDLNYRVHKQANALRAERKLLQEEIARRVSLEEKLAYEALHDPLTGLPNRRLFFERLEHAYPWSKRNPDNICAVLYLDLNKFKTINDTLGHEVGDLLLKQVADRLKSSVRDIDTVARMGGDEFAILLEAASTQENVEIILHRIRANLARLYELSGKVIISEASIGVIMSIAEYEQLDEILRDADTAMYQAKASGGNQYKVLNAEMQE